MKDIFKRLVRVNHGEEQGSKYNHIIAEIQDL